MKLYILGKTKEDKGNQLEILTKKILTGLGYRNISISYIGKGGEEIDLYAIKENVHGLKAVDDPVICECKAHEKVISMNDYNKFLGKVTSAKNKNKYTTGVLMALSGASGNVIGAHNESQNDIQLFAKDDIIQLLSKIYSLDSQSSVIEHVRKLTNRTIVSIDIVYYDHIVYWLISFTKNQYYLLPQNKQDFDSNLLPLVCKLIQNVAPISEYIDIEQEQLAYLRRTYIQSTMLMYLMTRSYEFNDLVQQINTSKHLALPATATELNEILNNCPFVTTNHNDISLIPATEINYIDFYRYLLRGQLNVGAISQQYYLEHIDRNLFDQIIQVQHYIKIPSEKIEDILFVLRFSPTALAYAINEDISITGYRGENGSTIHNNIDLTHSQMFMDKIMDCFDFDYCDNSHLHEFFLEKCSINHITKKKEIIIHYDDQTIRTLSQEQNLMLCRIEGFESIALVRKLVDA